MRLPEMWEEKQAELRSFSQPTLTLPQLCGREVSLPFKVQHAWLRQGPVQVRDILWNQNGKLSQEQFCLSAVATLPEHSSLLGSRGLAPSFLPVWLLGGSQSWCPCPATTGLGGSGVPHDSGQGDTVTLHGPSQSRPPKWAPGASSPALWLGWCLVAPALSIMLHWGGHNMEKDFVKSPAQSSTTSFFNKCVTLLEKLLVLSSQTRLIFL